MNCFTEERCFLRRQYNDEHLQSQLSIDHINPEVTIPNLPNLLFAIVLVAVKMASSISSYFYNGLRKICKQNKSNEVSAQYTV
jgi:hypothetical protein